MKYLFITTLILIFSQNVYADEAVSDSPEVMAEAEAVHPDPVIVSKVDEASEPGISSKSNFTNTNIEFSTVKYYELADKPNYKRKDRVILGGIVPFIPIRSTIDASVEDPGVLQKSVSFLLYFKQNF
ncbi:MAG: hypothetical protein ACR2NC_02000 [Thermodesulfobacteriota bacterium]